jgi:hypothetical protein
MGQGVLALSDASCKAREFTTVAARCVVRGVDGGVLLVETPPDPPPYPHPRAGSKPPLHPIHSNPHIPPLPFYNTNVRMGGVRQTSEDAALRGFFCLRPGQVEPSNLTPHPFRESYLAWITFLTLV